MVIFHIDVNNAFLSWDAVHRLTVEHEPLDLRTIPCIVGGDEKNRHGIVVAKSTPAKAFGIKTAETIAEARKKCPNILVIPSRHALYKEYSKKLITYLRSISPKVEQYSIDEAFVDMTDSPLLQTKTAMDAANHIRCEILEKFGFTVNIGVSSNRVLAKMASDFEKPNKVHSLFPNEIRQKMWPLPVRNLFFVGQASAKKLYNLGIRTIGELAVFDEEIIRLHLGKHGTLIHNYANGRDDSTVFDRKNDAKGYSHATTLPQDIQDREEALPILRKLCEKVSARLNKDQVAAQVIAVTIRDNQFLDRSHQCHMDNPTCSVSELFDYCCQLFDDLWNGSPIRLLGVATSKITKETSRQISIFDSNFYAKQGKIEDAMEQIREKYGEQAIFRGSSLDKTNK